MYGTCLQFYFQRTLCLVSRIINNLHILHAILRWLSITSRIALSNYPPRAWERKVNFRSEVRTRFFPVFSRLHTKESTLAISALLADKSQTWEPETHPSVIYEWIPQIKGSAIYRPEILPPSHSVIVSRRWIRCLLCQKRGTLTDLLHCCHLQQVGYKNVNTIRSQIELLEVAGDLI